MFVLDNLMHFLLQIHPGVLEILPELNFTLVYLQR